MPIYHQRLLERIALGSQAAEPMLEIDEQRLLDGVMEHLKHMLNVRQGNVPTLQNYGLPDFNDIEGSMRFENAVVELGRIIKQTLENFEPRLAKVRVRPRRDDLDPTRIGFEIDAQLALPNQRRRVSFHTRLESDGAISVQG